MRNHRFEIRYSFSKLVDFKQKLKQILKNQKIILITWHQKCYKKKRRYLQFYFIETIFALLSRYEILSISCNFQNFKHIWYDQIIIPLLLSFYFIYKTKR